MMPVFTANRRKFLLAGGGAAVAAASLPTIIGRKQGSPSIAHMTAEPGRLKVFADQQQNTEIWGYNRSVAGPEIRLRLGETVRLLFENKISQPTSIHWHGLRIPFAMDGVGSITQPGIQPGDSFYYDFTPPDAGLFWYHPHMNSEEQIARGMFGALIVEENEPPAVDREIIWSLYDWGLDADYQVPKKQAFHLWRGNADYTPHTKITMNGKDTPDILISRGERIRLRIANTSGNRRYALQFNDHKPWVIALDSNAVEPYPVGDKPLIIGTGERVDLVLDGAAKPGTYPVIDVFNRDFEPVPPWATPEEIAARNTPITVCNIVYRDGPALREVHELPPPTAPAGNHIPEPDLPNAIPVDIELNQHMTSIEDVPKIGAMAALLAEQDGIPRDHKVALWTMNSKVLLEDLNSYFCIDPEPLFECQLGRTYLLRFKNATKVDHPMHLHGHTFKMVRRNGIPFPRSMYRDTFTVFGGDTVEVAFVADNPGDWMIHCHRGMHQHGGMMSLFRVI